MKKARLRLEIEEEQKLRCDVAASASGDSSETAEQTSWPFGSSQAQGAAQFDLHR